VISELFSVPYLIVDIAVINGKLFAIGQPRFSNRWEIVSLDPYTYKIETYMKIDKHIDIYSPSEFNNQNSTHCSSDGAPFDPARRYWYQYGKCGDANCFHVIDMPKKNMSVLTLPNNLERLVGCCYSTLNDMIYGIIETLVSVN
jgi:hypothetical protein